MTKFCPEVTEKIIEAVKKGATYQIACDYAGIDYSNFRKWIVRGEEEKDTAYYHFREDIKKAQGATACTWLEVIDKAMAKGNWQAAAWKLERRYFKDYSDNPMVRTEIKALQKQFRALMKSEGAENDKRIEIKEMDSKSSQ